jgi:site-specific DNA-methyltransferase (adenine-specific)
MNNSSSIYGGGKGIQFKEGIRNYAKDADSGGASRFFYCAKAGSEERAFWCTVCEAAFMLDMESGHTHGKPDRAHLTYHPTVKPQEIAEWLIRLVTPKGGIVLDPFVGSGTTLVAAKRLGFESVGVDQDPTYIKLARRRCGLDVVGPMDRFADGAH